MATQIVKPLILDSYIAMIKNSVGIRMFRNFYARVKGKVRDLNRNGELSCAIYVSTILIIFELIKKTHATVASTVKDMEEFGWKKIMRPRLGCVLLWEEKKSKDGETHQHLGFYVGNKKAISNSSKTGTPHLHHWTYGAIGNRPKRKIIAMYWNNKLKN